MTRIRKTGLALGLAFVVLGSTGCSYNTFVSQEEAIKAQWAQVENQLQRRNDLIPNLVETVKGYAAHLGRGTLRPLGPGYWYGGPWLGVTLLEAGTDAPGDGQNV